MKNCIKLFGIITLVVVIGFSFLSCEQELEVEPTSGSLRITGLAEFNNKNVMAYGYDPQNNPAYMAAGGLSTDGTATNVVVRNGVATLKVWKVTNGADFSKFADFDGNNQNVIFQVRCYESVQEEGGYGIIGTVTVNFSGNGQGEGVFVKGTYR